MLTKGDLLSAEDLYASRVVVAQDVAQFTKLHASSNPNLKRGDNIAIIGEEEAQTTALQAEVDKLLASEVRPLPFLPFFLLCASC